MPRANLKVRLARQAVLDRAELRVVILESVLYREVGDAATMGDQLQHLLAVGSRLLARATRVFDGLRADALPWTQTQDLLTKAGERWTL